MDKVIAESGIDAVIYRVAQKANISEGAATIAVDEVLTAVKETLPSAMAANLVNVVAGEESFSGWIDIADKFRAPRSMVKNFSKDRLVELSRRVKEGAAHTGRLSTQYTARAADKVTTLWAHIKKTATKR